jgi:hypothetical protein
MTLSNKLRYVADRLDDNTLDFDWEKQHKCCCGVVAQILLSKTQFEIRRQFQTLTKATGGGEYVTWGDLTNRVCPITGMPEAEMFRQLYEAGLTREDIIHLEYLSDPKVLALMPPKKKRVLRWFCFREVNHWKYDEEDSRDLAVYLRGLAKLKEQQVTGEEFVQPSVNRIAELQRN